MINHDPFVKEGLVVLDFGGPWFPDYPSHYRWGTHLIYPPYPFVPSSDIYQAVKQFAIGFIDTAKTAPNHPFLTIAVGTSNFVNWDDKTLEPIYTESDFQLHGIYWGELVNSLSDKFSGSSKYVAIEGANDFEYGFSPPAHALRWAQGFESITRDVIPSSGHVYYDYGSCDSCYPRSGAGNDPRRCVRAAPLPTPAPTYCWTLDEMVGVHWANRAARPLPEIYAADWAPQWQWLSSYAATHNLCLIEYGIPANAIGRMYIQGVTADVSQGYLAGEGWQDLFRSLSGTSCTTPSLTPTITRPEMEYVTNIGKRLP